MKKTALIIALCGLLLAAGCAGQEPNAPDHPGIDQTTTPEQNTGAVLTVGDYFPIMENVRYVYQGEGNEYAAYTVFNDYTAADRVQQSVDNGGTVIAKVIVLADNKLTQTFASGEAYYRENRLDMINGEEVLLMAPIIAGTAWTLADGSSRAITATDAAVTTPNGNYQAVEVTTAGPDSTTIHYYATGTGLIKTVYRTGDTEISSTLSAVEQNAAAARIVRFFYPDQELNGLVYLDRDLAFHTNDSTLEILAAAYRETPPGAAKVFSARTVINSLALDDDGLIHLDLNQDFLTEMNAGSDYEGLILQSLAGTFGYYYNSKQVALTLEGQAYESGHFSLKAGEPLPTDTDAATPLQL